MHNTRRPLKNFAAEAQQFRRRAALGFLAVLMALAGLALWYLKLQVIDHSEYASRSEANRVRLQPVVPGRGLIYDRKGRILADNVPAFRLDITPDRVTDIERELVELGRIISLRPEDLQRFRVAYRAAPSHRAVTLKLRLSDEETARFAVDRWRFPGVELVPYLNCRYLYGDLFAHVIGYVGRIDEKDLAKLGEPGTAFSHTGKTGLERYYEEALRGRVGYEQIETNVEGRALRTVGHVPAMPGADLRLSVDLDLQRAMVAAFGEMQGSAVAVDPKTGEILAMVSLPSYDPNLFVNGISHVDYRTLTTDPARPLFNRNVLGGGPPGSTIKPLLALAGLDSGLRTPEYRVFSTGEFRIPGQRRGWRDAYGGAGWTDLRKSISASVNYYYYKLAYEMGIVRFDQYMRKYGFGQLTGIDLAGENKGIVPSPQWKATRSKERWYPGETINSGIGQGYWIATALQLVRGTAAIADGGELRRPHLAMQRREGYNTPWLSFEQPAPQRITDNPNNLRAVQEGMIATIHGGGTAAAMSRGATYQMAGKTGTSQKVGRRGAGKSVHPRDLPYHLRHQALFVGYAPANDPTIAVAIVVEHGGYGATTAAPIARKIFDAWLVEQPGPGTRDPGPGTTTANASDRVESPITSPPPAKKSLGQPKQPPRVPMHMDVQVPRAQDARERPGPESPVPDPESPVPDPESPVPGPQPPIPDPTP